MLILNSRYRGIVKKIPLYCIHFKRGIIIPLYHIQGDYPQKCCHSALALLRCFHLEYGVEARVRILQSGSQSIVTVSVGMRPVGDSDVI